MWASTPTGASVIGGRMEYRASHRIRPLRSFDAVGGANFVIIKKFRNTA